MAEELDAERFVGGAGEDKLQKDYAEAQKAAQKKSATDADRKAYKKKAKELADQRQADRAKMEKDGTRIGPNTPPEVLEALQEAAAAAEGDGVASAEPPSAKGEVSNP